MSRRLARLFIKETQFSKGLKLTLPPTESRRVTQVMRVIPGDERILSLFNAQAGEWKAKIISNTKSSGVHVELTDQIRTQPPAPFSVTLMFTPLKKDATSLLLEKATELGVTQLCPMYTQRTQQGVIKDIFSSKKKSHANKAMSIVQQAAEQSDRLCLPRLHSPLNMADLVNKITNVHGPESIWVCCEPSLKSQKKSSRLFDVLADIDLKLPDRRRLTLMIGPEGGFSPHEVEWLEHHPGVKFVSLGKNTLRAETAALSALALIHSRTS